MDLSHRQKDVVEAWENTNKNILINAIPGSGKSFIILYLIKMMTQRVLYLAFNSSIQKEMEEKLHGLAHAKAMTFHALGLSAIRGHYKTVNIKSNKNFDIVKQVQNTHKKFFKHLTWEDKLKISYTLCDLHDLSRIFLTTDLSELKVHAAEVGKEIYVYSHIESHWGCFLELRDKSYEGSIIDIDFTDMIFLPIYKNFSYNINPLYLAIDECQDLNKCQHAMVDKLIAENGVERWLSVGDFRQTIYSFSGALSNSFELFRTRDNVLELPLDICYRCPQLVVEQTNKVYDTMTGFKQNQGVVGVVSEWGDIKSPSLVICRNKAPLFEVLFLLLANGRKAYFKGEDILKSVERFLKPYSTYSITRCDAELKITKLDLEKDKTESGRIQVFLFEENYKIYKMLKTVFYINNGVVSDILTKLKALFVEDVNSIALCTIHKSKGLEADIVYILNEKDTIPSKFATTKEALIQEENLRYVARSRAREEMYYLNLKGGTYE